MFYFSNLQQLVIKYTEIISYNFAPRKEMQFKIRKSIDMELVDWAKFIYRIINAAMNLQEAEVQERRAIWTKDGSNF